MTTETKKYYAISKDRHGFPSDCMLYDTMDELREEAGADYDLEDGSYVYTAELVVSKVQLVMYSKKTSIALKKVGKKIVFEHESNCNAALCVCRQS